MTRFGSLDMVCLTTRSASRINLPTTLTLARNARDNRLRRNVLLASFSFMERHELWAAYVAKNPQFNGAGNVTLSASGLRKMFEQTWERGRENGFANGKAYAENQAKIRTSKSDRVSDLIKGFGLG